MFAENVTVPCSDTRHKQFAEKKILAPSCASKALYKNLVCMVKKLYSSAPQIWSSKTAALFQDTQFKQISR